LILSVQSVILPVLENKERWFKMGYIEIFRLDEQGAGWVDLSEATPQELLDLEIGLFQEGAL